jgi:hypothetical protein
MLVQKGMHAYECAYRKERKMSQNQVQKMACGGWTFSVKTVSLPFW